jgi:hypothetical protein
LLSLSIAARTLIDRGDQRASFPVADERDAQGLLREVFRVLEVLRDGLGDGGADLDAVIGLVVDDAKVEGVEEGSLGLGCGVSELSGWVASSAFSWLILPRGFQSLWLGGR